MLDLRQKRISGRSHLPRDNSQTKHKDNKLPSDDVDETREDAGQIGTERNTVVSKRGQDGGAGLDKVEAEQIAGSTADQTYIGEGDEKDACSCSGVPIVIQHSV